MKTLPNSLTVFNATPHPIRFQCGSDIIEVETDAIINASVSEEVVAPAGWLSSKVSYVEARFDGNKEGRAIAIAAYEAGADVVVGSLIAAQAYPGLVVAMIAAEGYERVPPDQKRARPDKFTVFESGKYSF